MGELKIKLPDDLERRFRKLAMQRFGYQKGSMSKAAEEAIETWGQADFEEESSQEDPIEAISGLLKHVKKSSVQLQHEAWDFIVDKHNKRYKKKHVS